MKKFLFLLLIASALAGPAASQTLAIQVVAAAGDTFTAANGAELDWTLGEPVVETFANQAVLTQGFHQAFDLATPVLEQPLSDILLKVYPNPASNRLTIEAEAAAPLRAQLFDLFGRLLLTVQLQNRTEQLDVSHLPAGTFLLSILEERPDRYREVQVFKIQKFSF
ncbi:MAG: T9SS type A sorting domain-containing protein [Bacteroidetes bacterium]|nr:T9SS type A sorting domain-containing protein [Bacteroidota bacterium]